MQLSVERVDTPPPRQGPACQQARLLLEPGREAEQSPYLKLAEDWFTPPGGFPTQPNCGMEMVSLVLDGSVHHHDHTGTHEVSKAGDVAFVTAGAGVLQSKTPGPHGVHLLSLWLNLPARLKSSPPKFTSLRHRDAPLLHAPGIEARLLAGRLGELHQARSGLWPLTMIDLHLESGARFELPLPAGERGVAVVLAGEVRLGAGETRAAAPSVAWLALSTPGAQTAGTGASTAAASSAGTDSLAVEAVSAARVLVYASPPIDEAVAVRGPFAMCSEAELDRAFADARAGRLTLPRR